MSPEPTQTAEPRLAPDQPGVATPFVWPPSPATLAQPEPPLGPAPISRARARATPDQPPTVDAAASRGSGVSTRLAFERTWLGLIAPPWSVRAAEADWRPDDASAACPHCAGPVGPGEVVGELDAARCSACRDTRLPWSRALRLGAFEGVLREAILEAKYAKWRRLALDLGLQLGQSIAHPLREAGREQGFDPAEAVIVPVPMSFRRRWTRGIDHTLAIARGVRAVTGCRIVHPLRRRHRPAQASLPESGREANARGSFLPRSGGPLSGYPLILVLDDVRTSGATLRAACRGMAARERHLGGRLSTAQIWVATLAVVSPVNRRARPDEADEPPQDSRDEE